VTYQVSIEDRQQQQTAVVRGHAPHDGVGRFVGSAFNEVLGALTDAGVPPVGPPFARYRIVDDGFDIEAGFPVLAAVATHGRVEASTLPGGPIATTMHVGSYAAISAAFAAVESWLAGSTYRVDGDPWEAYLDGPEVAEPRTLVCFPCRAS
jgi:effector-binding domain-containing protein